jgi:hypothetical protein
MKAKEDTSDRTQQEKIRNTFISEAILARRVQQMCHTFTPRSNITGFQNIADPT